MDTINRRLTVCFAMIGIIIGLTVACEKDEPDPFRQQCIESEIAVANCAGYDLECTANCFDECTSLGHKAAKSGEDCGKRWLAVHACVSALDCEDLEAWEDAHWAGESGFPCEDLELEFREKCPEAPLFLNDP